jgi:uncharacterized protein (DUF2147 family)
MMRGLRAGRHLALMAAGALAATSAWSLDSARLAGDWLAPAEDADDVDAVITLVPEAPAWAGYIKAIRITRPDQKLHDGTPCALCSGPKQGHALKGLEVICDLHEAGDKFKGGRILDPGDGQVYDCEMHLSADGKTLQVTAFKGLKMFGHTMTWQRL